MWNIQILSDHNHKIEQNWSGSAITRRQTGKGLHIYNHRHRHASMLQSIWVSLWCWLQPMCSTSLCTKGLDLVVCLYKSKVAEYLCRFSVKFLSCSNYVTMCGGYSEFLNLWRYAGFWIKGVNLDSCFKWTCLYVEGNRFGKFPQFTTNTIPSSNWWSLLANQLHHFTVILTRQSNFEDGN